MLVENTEDDVDANVVSVKNKYTTKLKKMKELHANTMVQLAENKMKQNMYKIKMFKNHIVIYYNP